MAKEPTTREDFENMSDEDFMKLSEHDYSGNAPEDQDSLTSESSEYEEPIQQEDNSESTDGTDTSDDSVQPDSSGDNFDSGSSENEEEEDPEGAGEEEKSDPMSGGEEEDPAQTSEQSQSDPEEEGEKTGEEDSSVKKGKDTPAKAGYYKLPEGTDTATVDSALGFYEMITKPFKADGKDFTVRNPEDAIRLMQQGVNYSRRMQEIKPMKQLNRMLSDQGLNDPAQLNFLIDLSKGDKGAITQLLKSHKIDPMDLDTESENRYQARNYQGNPQDNEFRDALDTALTTPEGQALVSHIHADWDTKSKGRLREDPSILGNLQNLKASGVYDKVVEEVNYQKSMGYLAGVPFLQAFDQVGEAMKNAGVFTTQANPAQSGGNSMAPLKSQPQSQPVASGARKSTGSKKPETNPHLSSTPPSKQTGNTPKTPDFDKLSDEDFLKMPPPE